MEPTGPVEQYHDTHGATAQRAPTTRWYRPRAVIGHQGLTLVEAVLVVAIVAVLASVAGTTYRDYRERADVRRAVDEITTIALKVKGFAAEHRRLPIDLAEAGQGRALDPWGRPYRYVNHLSDPKAAFRRDRSNIPINADFDLYSIGKDGDTTPPLTATASRDDIVRADNGAFVGLASVYDP